MISFPVRSELRRERFKRAGLHVCLGAFALAGIILNTMSLDNPATHPELTDFKLFHHSAKNFWRETNLYEPIPLAADSAAGASNQADPDRLHPNLNPPFQTVVFSPLGLLSFRAAFLTWALLSLVAGIVGALLIGWHGVGAKDRILASLVVTNLFLFYYPTLISVLIGQWSLVPFLCLVLAWLAWRKGSFRVAGGILGTLAGIKLFFGVFLLFFLVRREWRAAIWFSGVGLLSVLLSTVIIGPDSLLQYLQTLKGVGWYSASWNASILGFVTRVFGEAGNESLVHMPHISATLGGALSLFGLFLLVIVGKRRVFLGREKPMDDLAFSSCIVIMLLVSPLGWIYYFPFLLIPLTAIWKGSQLLSGGGSFRTLVVLAWLLSTMPKTLVKPDDLGGDPVIILWWAGTYFYALVLFLALLWRIQGRLAEESVAA